ncbi:MAG: S41 family peptidase [Vicingus serpentipes]|nr:S41 family peptidase [Vicingus serpentipes]
MSNNKKLIFLLSPIIIALFFVVGIYLGAILSNSSTSSNKTVIFSKNKRFNTTTKLNEILNFISDTYVDSVDKRELTEKSISSMLSQLDPHSYYIPAREFDDMNEPLEGNFDGIGIEFRLKNDTVLVIAPVANGPSEKLGIKAGDRIIKVDTIPIAGVNITNEKVIKLLKGPRGTKVNVIIKRVGVKKPLRFTITRDRIPIYSVDSPYMITKNTGYLKITRFAKTTYAEFLKATDQLQKEGMKNLIIDLRGNGGGVLSAATNIADEILPKNKMIVYTDGRVRNKSEYFSSAGGSLEHTNIVILINENSASASEILAGAIQDNDKGTIIGRRSFGKGLVQEQVVWPDGSALRLTVARYYTPTGRCIQKPYEEGAENYRAEAYNRYTNGELLSSDSIHFHDSLKYYTPEGKVVYGGGGIMPDIFVPLDTNGGSNYLYELRYRGIVQDFALNFVDKKRKELIEQYETAVNFKNNFTISNDLFNSLIKYADENEVKRNLSEIQLSKELILRDVKAAICRNLFNDLGYYVIVNEYDNTVQEAIKVLSDYEKRH